MNYWKFKKFIQKHLIAVIAGGAAVIIAVIALIALTGGPATGELLSRNAAIETPSVSYQTAAVASTEPSAGMSPEPSPDVTASGPSAAPSVSPEPSASASPSPKPSEKPKEPKKTTKKPKAKAPDIDKLVAAFEVKSKDYYNDKSYSSNHYEYTSKELKMLAIIIYREARNQPYSCQVAVGNVVMNRVLSPGYPGSTIEAVVTRKNQFAWKASVTPNSECYRVARDILDYEVWTVPQNTYFFRANKSKSDWGSHEYYKHLGNTAFYQANYSGRYRGDTVPPALFKRTYRWPQYGCKPATRVKKIQKMLKGLGYKVSTDGYFGIDTEKALMKFQKSRGLKADGVAGQSTLKALIRKYSVEKYMKL